jgi:hypothetical protein
VHDITAMFGVFIARAFLGGILHIERPLSGY